MSMAAPSDLTYDENLVSDLHKDAYGFRPSADFRDDWRAADPARRQAIWNELLAAHRSEMADYEERRRLAIEAFEAAISKLIGTGAGDRQTAIRWYVDSLKADDGLVADYGSEYVICSLNLPDRYRAEFDAAIGRRSPSMEP